MSICGRNRRMKDDDGKRSVLFSCGRCREFIRQMREENLLTGVLLGRDYVVKLRDLLQYPYGFGPVGL